MEDYFLTINKDGVFLGKNAAIKYRGEKLDKYHIQDITKWFSIENDSLSPKPQFTELYVMSSESAGLFSVSGKPSLKHGKYVWARAKSLGGAVSDWTYLCELKNPSDAAKFAIVSAMTGINLGVIFEYRKNQKTR